MVSLWPWKGDNTSPESFEKALSAISAKITFATGTLEGRRQNARRFKALWTLYTSIAYLLYVMIVSLVVGWQGCTQVEYTILAGSPVIIYLGRLSLTTFYNYRISTLQEHVNSLQKQRDTTISKLKAATKFDSTQQLLEKYGGNPAKSKQSKASEGRKADSSSQKTNQNPQRTGFVPPPTANIPGRNRGQQALPVDANRQELAGGLKSQQSNSSPGLDASRFQPQDTQNIHSEQAEFAPNAFPSQFYAPPEGPKWYDRLMDVLLGEDESNPKNRLALICNKCRLVNGQAPPGVRQLEDVGKWRCSSCGTMNGEVSEARRLMSEIQDLTHTDSEHQNASMSESTIAEGGGSADFEGTGHDSDTGDLSQYSANEGSVPLEESQQTTTVSPRTRRSKGKDSSKKPS